VIRLTVMMYIRYPLSLRQVEDILFERGIGICHETVRYWWNRFGPMPANEIRETTPSSSVAFAMALAPRRGIRQDQWRDALSLARADARNRQISIDRAERRLHHHIAHELRGSGGHSVGPTHTHCIRNACEASAIVCRH
jgi:hypothetical protein